MTRQQVPNVELARDAARANLLTNGGFEIWQRGNGPFAGAYASRIYCADRWSFVMGASGATMSVSREASIVDSNSQYSLAVTLGGTGPQGDVRQEIQNEPLIYGLRGKTIAVSVRVRTSVANAIRLGIDGAVFSAYHTGGGTWETLTTTSAIGASATGVLVYLSIVGAGTFYLDSAMLVIGSVAADYAPLHPADDLARCLRYYEILGETPGSMMVQGYGAATNVIYNTFGYKARKPVTPTLTKVGTWTLLNATGQPVADVAGIDQMRMNISVTATGYAYAFNNGAGIYMTAESNP